MRLYYTKSVCVNNLEDLSLVTINILPKFQKIQYTMFHKRTARKACFVLLSTDLCAIQT